MVYPLGFEPKLDGVGGRNVIQLHYGYLIYSRAPERVFRSVVFIADSGKAGRNLV